MNPTNGVVLLAEDNADDQELTVMALERNRIANPVVVVNDGAEALDWLFMTGAHAGRDPALWPALVVLDLNMPRIGGLAALKRIRADERTRRLPVVIFTTSREEQDLIASYDLGANGYVRKPVDSQKFTEAVGRLGLYWLLLNELPVRDRS